MKIFTETEINQYEADGTFNPVEVINHRTALAKSLEPKIEPLNASTTRLYIDTKAVCNPTAKWQERHLEPIIEAILVTQTLLTKSELDDIAFSFPEEDDLSRNSFDFINKSVASILFPENDLTEVNLTYKWIPNFVLTYSEHIRTTA